MTQIKFKNGINDVQMSVLLNLCKLWNVEAEIEQGNSVLQNETEFVSRVKQQDFSATAARKAPRGYLTHEQFVEKSNKEIDILCKEYGIL